MKTEIERVCEIIETLLAHQPIIDVPYDKINDIAVALVKEGYGNVKQAQIDVLNELKTRHDYAIKNMGYPWDITQQIDELIKEIEK